MSTIEVKIEQYEGEIDEIKNVIKKIDNGEGNYSTWDVDKRYATIMLEKQSIISKETLINTLLQQKSGKNNCKVISSI